MTSIVSLASSTACVGRLNEPRIYFDRLQIADTQGAGVPVYGSPDVFRNGEDFPVQIRHLVMGLGAATDERYAQRISLQIRDHDHYYMGRNYVPLPLWHNTRVSSPVSVNPGYVTWRFNHPVVLSARDTLRIQVQLLTAPDNGRTVRVASHGKGRLTNRPYFFESSLELTDAVATNLPLEGFRNDGAEPVELYDMTATITADSGATDPAGDTRLGSIQISQIGNGTGADWLKGPISPTPLERGLISLLGNYTGRYLVHELPADGWIWEPGESLDVSITRSGTLPVGTHDVWIAMVGHIAVP